MKRSFVLAALCPFLLACAEPERPLFLHAQAALAVPAGDAVEVVIAGIPPGYEVEGIVLLDHERKYKNPFVPSVNSGQALSLSKDDLAI